MKNRVNVMLVLAIIFGLTATWGIYQYLEHMKNMYKSSGKFVAVAVAREKIPARTKITDQMVEFKEMPSNFVAQNAVTEKSEMINRVSKGDIFPGEQILKSELIAPHDPSGGVAMMVEPGRRAVTIAVDPVAGVAGALKPDDRIDAVVVVDLSGQDKAAVASTFLQNIRILAVSNAVGGNNKSAQPTTQLVTLSLSPPEAQQLALASTRGSVRLILRTPGDQSITAVPSSQINNLIR